MDYLSVSALVLLVATSFYLGRITNFYTIPIYTTTKYRLTITNEIDEVLVSDEDVLSAGLSKKPVEDFVNNNKGNMTGYATISNLTKYREKYNKALLSETEEKNLVKLWTRLVCGKTYEEAAKVVKSKGYQIHIFQINRGRIITNRNYDPTTVSVQIKDDDYNYGKKLPSETATINKIYGMGGQKK